MRRKIFLAIAFAVSLTAGQAMAQDFQSKYTQELTDQGFTNLNITKTWLGRTRITAVSKTQSREFVFDSYTGEVLRDYSENLDSSQLSPSNTEQKDPTEMQGGSDDSGNGGSESGGSGSGNGGGDSESGGDNGGDNGGDSGGDNGGDSGGSGGGDGGHAALDLGPSPLDFLTGVNPHMTV